MAGFSMKTLKVEECGQFVQIGWTTRRSDSRMVPEIAAQHAFTSKMAQPRQNC
jgi:hypothetical protein